jgi:hypothetical protein
MVRRHPTKDTVVLEHLGQLIRVLGQGARVDRVGGAAYARQVQHRGDRADRAGVVPGDDFQRDALFGEVAQGLLCVIAQVLTEEDEGVWKEVCRQVGVNVDPGVRVCEQQDPGALRGEGVGALSGARLLLAHRCVEDHLRCTKQPAAVSVGDDGRPLAGRGERHRIHLPPLRGLHGGRQCRRRRVRVTGPGQQAQRVTHIGLIRTRAELQPVETHLPVRQRPGLVQAHDVDPRQGLHCG